MRTQHRPRAWARILITLIDLYGCDGDGLFGRSPLQTLGVQDAPTRPPEWYTMLCHEVAGACVEGAAVATLERLATEAFQRPGSHLEVWSLGKNTAETELVGAIDVPLRQEHGRSALREAQERFLATARAAICPPLESRLMQRRSHRSPIAEAIAKTLLSNARGLPRRLVIASPGRETGVSDFECGRLPTESEWLARLRRRDLFAPGSLAGARVHFTLMHGGAVPGRGCAVTVERELGIRRLWSAAFQRAGAVEVTFDANLIDFRAMPALRATSAVADTDSTPSSSITNSRRSTP